MTNINNVGYTPIFKQTAVQNNGIQPYGKEGYTTRPYPNDVFVSSKKPEQKKNDSFLKKALMTAIIIAGGSAVARKYVPQLQKYVKVTENANAKQKVMNVIATIGDKTLDVTSKVAKKVQEHLKTAQKSS
ncbi:MAG: hypothetical protein DKM22_04535 [Candidatus Melainabacteria bacterium]|nr:MAG: hypothetical protein DKM22_04535 [Candidatus Melainabacteria bacterium]